MKNTIARVTVTPCSARDLQPGDLYTFIGQKYWDGASDTVCEQVCVRLNGEPLHPASYNEVTVFRVAIEVVEVPAIILSVNADLLNKAKQNFADAIAQNDADDQEAMVRQGKIQS